jgi:alcohol dehydrogenase class IV
MQLAIPSLAAYGIRAKDTFELVEKASRSNSMKGNPIPLTSAELRAIVESSL